ncbi:hypothetical protein PP496_gp55 [Gordonia phage Yeet412]|uniref:Uncharacterized protein n=1 Tax=Gordonia phage Yeet412 TaxID=2836044 RepID=A0A8F3IPX9_9CAUD|nr:hypothetical protein PP496_gp55 [Gordonia phage Yeet412]QTF81769.1 hypothetical protein SEA_BEEGEE_66 [Gordonia phage BeeGee]QWY84564.1 hypothetical protein SEA_YEET412_55 [Gordonia phage Yeet412]
MTDSEPMSDDFPGVTVADEKRIRNAERHKVAYLLEKSGDTLVEYLSDPKDAVSLIAYLLRLEANRDV